jgi:hypothetical protein
MVEQGAIIDFSKYILERTQNFTGREWVFQAINDWLADSEAPRFFLITGEPGSGKTGIAARLHEISSNGKTTSSSDQLPYIKPDFLSAIHFCSARDTYWRDPQTFARSIALQVAQQERYDVFAKALAEKSTDRIHIEAKLENVTAHGQNANITAVRIGNIEIKGAPTEDVFNRLIREPLQALFDEKPNEQVIILVDALDEALVYSGDVNIVSLLADSQNLPKGVRFIITSRKDERVENRFFGSAGLYLSSVQFNEQNQNDISNYVRKRFSNDEKLASKVKDRKQEQLSDLINTITLKADGNFQYITFLLNSISSGYQELEEIDKLPHGLDALYYESLGRLISPGSNDWLNYSSLLGILSVAQESLTQVQLQNYTRLSESIIWTSLGKLQQFIEETDNGANEKSELVYRLYHQSFVDFLGRQSLIIENKRLRNSYYLLAEEGHKRIVDYYHAGSSWDKIDWSKVDNYGLLYLSRHLYSLKDVKANGTNVYPQELYGLICKPFMQDKLQRFGSHMSFASDIELAIETARSEQPPNLSQVVRMNLIIFTIQILVNETPPQALSALTLIGKETKAIGFSALIANRSTKRIEAYIYIVQALLHRQEIDKAIAVIVKLLHENDDNSLIKFYLTRLAPFIAQVQELDQLVKVAKAIATDKSREYWWILSNVALELLFKDKNKEVFEVVDRIEDLNARARVLGIIAQIFSRRDRTEKARQIINQLLELVKSTEDNNNNILSKAQTLSDAAAALVQIGEKEKVIDIVKQMQAMTGRIIKEQDKGTILSLLAPVLAQANKYTDTLKVSRQVQRIAEGIEDESIRENMLNRIVVALDLIDEHEKAVRVANLTKYHTDISKVGGLTHQGGYSRYNGKYVTVKPEDLDQVSIISTWEPWMPGSVKFVRWDDQVDYHNIGYLDQRDDIEKALAKAENSGELYKTNVLSSIAELLFLRRQRNSFFSSALSLKESIAHRMEKIAETISNGQYRSKALAAVALAFAIENMDSKAEEIANKALKVSAEYEYRLDLGSKEQTLAAFAKSLAQYQEFDEAHKVADQIKNNWEKAKVMKVIVRELAKTKRQQDKAEKVANQILSMAKETADNSSVEAIAIEALTWAGKVEQAQEMLQNIGLTTKVDLLIDMALALAELGKNNQSVKLAKVAQTSIISHKLEGLEKVAKAFAKANDFVRALKTIKKIESKELQIRALIDTACALIEAGNKQKAKEIADQAWSTSVEFASTDTVRNNQSIPTPKLPVDSLAWAEVRCLADCLDNLDKRWEPNSTVQAIFPQIMRPQFEEILNTFDQKMSEKGSAITRWELGSLPYMAYILTISGQVERALSLFIKTLILIHDKPLKEDINNPLGEPGYLRASKLNATFMVLAGYTPLIATIDQGRTLWKIYETIVELEGWWSVYG